MQPPVAGIFSPSIQVRLVVASSTGLRMRHGEVEGPAALLLQLSHRSHRHLRPPDRLGRSRAGTQRRRRGQATRSPPGTCAPDRIDAMTDHVRRAAPGEAAGPRQVPPRRRPRRRRRALAAAFALDTARACLAADPGRRGAGRHRRRRASPTSCARAGLRDDPRRCRRRPQRARCARPPPRPRGAGRGCAGGAVRRPAGAAPGRPRRTRWRGSPPGSPAPSSRTRDGVGTTLYTAPYDAFDPRFGRGSRAAHLDAGAVEIAGAAGHAAPRRRRPSPTSRPRWRSGVGRHARPAVARRPDPAT